MHHYAFSFEDSAGIEEDWFISFYRPITESQKLAVINYINGFHGRFVNMRALRPNSPDYSMWISVIRDELTYMRVFWKGKAKFTKNWVP